MVTSDRSLDKLGVVVIGRNEGERLTRCLQSLNPAELPVVYVDSGSADGSIENAGSLGAIVASLDMSKPFTAARARNTGYAVLKEHEPLVENVQFVDGDCILASEWVSTASKFLSDHSRVAAVCGRRREINPDLSIYNWICDVEWATPIGESDACGGDILMRTVAFESCGGYRESLVAGEEPELCFRLREAGWKIWRIDAEMTLHDAAITRFSQWWKRSLRTGYGMMDVATLHFSLRSGIWVRECLRAILFGGFLPLIFVGGMLFPTLFLIALVYPLQVLKIAYRKGIHNPKSWKYALIMTVSKFAEFTGIVKFTLDKLKHKRPQIIEYK